MYIRFDQYNINICFYTYIRYNILFMLAKLLKVYRTHALLHVQCHAYAQIKYLLAPKIQWNDVHQKNCYVLRL